MVVSGEDVGAALRARAPAGVNAFIFRVQGNRTLIVPLPITVHYRRLEAQNDERQQDQEVPAATFPQRTARTTIMYPS